MKAGDEQATLRPFACTRARPVAKTPITRRGKRRVDLPPAKPALGEHPPVVPDAACRMPGRSEPAQMQRPWTRTCPIFTSFLSGSACSSSRRECRLLLSASGPVFLSRRADEARFLEIFTFVYEDDREKYSGPMIMSPSPRSPAGARSKQSPEQLGSRLCFSPAARSYSHRVH